MLLEQTYQPYRLEGTSGNRGRLGWNTGGGGGSSTTGKGLLVRGGWHPLTPSCVPLRDMFHVLCLVGQWIPVFAPVYGAFVAARCVLLRLSAGPSCLASWSFFFFERTPTPPVNGSDRFQQFMTQAVQKTALFHRCSSWTRFFPDSS